MVHQVIADALSERSRTGSEPKGFWRRLVNKVFDNYRREQVHQRMVGRRAAALRDAERRGSGGKAGEDEAIGREFREAIEHAVAELSENDREIWRRLGMSETYAEIAKALGKSTAAIKQAAYRIRAHVRSRLPLEYQRT
jgi:RNA polymerase sigma factor (sigma-70 family)